MEDLFTIDFWVDHIHYTMGIFVIILGAVVARLFVALLVKLLDHSIATPEDAARNKAIMKRVKFPIHLVFLVSAVYVVHQLGDFPPAAEPYLNKAIKITLDIAFFMTLYYFSGAVVLTRLFDGFGIKVNDTVKSFIANAVKTVVAVLGVVTVLGAFNINIGPVLGGLTVLTSAVALAAKDSIQGLLGSLTVVLEGKFKEGDWIKMGGLQGFVENIGIRTTSIRGFDRSITVIPNNTFAGAEITNFSRVNNWEVNVEVVVSYKAKQRQLENIIMRYRDWLANSADIESDPSKAPMVVRMNTLTDHGYNLFLFFYTKTADWIEHMRVREMCMMQLIKIVEEEGTSLAYPTQSVILENDSAEALPSAKTVTKKVTSSGSSVKKPAVKAAPKAKK